MLDGNLQEILDHMSIEQKVGQVIMLSLSDFSPEYLEENITLIKKYNIGGIFHFKCMREAYTNAINALQRNTGIPLMIAGDYEVGPGWTIIGGLVTPRLMTRGYKGDTGTEYKIGKLIGEQGRAIGTTVTFSPVVDLNTNPLNPDINNRSFGEDVDKVSELAISHIRGLEEGGMLACVKHFPGNGGTDMDQHILSAVIPYSREKMENSCLKVYKNVFENTDVSCVMVAHIEVPSLTNETNPKNGRPVPASASYEVVTELLREQLGFKGMIITDALDMGGITTHYTRAEMAVKCIQAGNDMLLVFRENCDVEYHALLEAVRTGAITMERLNNAVWHVLVAKKKAGLFETKGLPVREELLDALFQNDQHSDFLEGIIRKGITLLRNRNGVLPIKDVSGKKVLVLSTFNPDRKTHEVYQDFEMMEDITPDLLKSRGAIVEMVEIEDNMPNPVLYEILSKVEKADYTFLNFFIWPLWGIGSLMPNKSALRLFYYGLLSIEKPIVITAFGSPYTMYYCPNAPVYLCTYDEDRTAQSAAVKAWLGEEEVTGRSPVSLPGMFNYGDGIDLVYG